MLDWNKVLLDVTNINDKEIVKEQLLSDNMLEAIKILSYQYDEKKLKNFLKNKEIDKWINSNKLEKPLILNNPSSFFLKLSEKDILFKLSNEEKNKLKEFLLAKNTLDLLDNKNPQNIIDTLIYLNANEQEIEKVISVFKTIYNKSQDTLEFSDNYISGNTLEILLKESQKKDNEFLLWSIEKMVKQNEVRINDNLDNLDNLLNTIFKIYEPSIKEIKNLQDIKKLEKVLSYKIFFRAKEIDFDNMLMSKLNVKNLENLKIELENYMSQFKSINLVPNNEDWNSNNIGRYYTNNDYWNNTDYIHIAILLLKNLDKNYVKKVHNSIEKLIKKVEEKKTEIKLELKNNFKQYTLLGITLFNGKNVEDCSLDEIEKLNKQIEKAFDKKTVEEFLNALSKGKSTKINEKNAVEQYNKHKITIEQNGFNNQINNTYYTARNMRFINKKEQELKHLKQSIENMNKLISSREENVFFKHLDKLPVIQEIVENKTEIMYLDLVEELKKNSENSIIICKYYLENKKNFDVFKDVFKNTEHMVDNILKNKLFFDFNDINSLEKYKIKNEIYKRNTFVQYISFLEQKIKLEQSLNKQTTKISKIISNVDKVEKIKEKIQYYNNKINSLNKNSIIEDKNELLELIYNNKFIIENNYKLVLSLLAESLIESNRSFFKESEEEKYFHSMMKRMVVNSEDEEFIKFKILNDIKDKNKREELLTNIAHILFKHNNNNKNTNLIDSLDEDFAIKLMNENILLDSRYSNQNFGFLYNEFAELIKNNEVWQNKDFILTFAKKLDEENKKNLYLAVLEYAPKEVKLTFQHMLNKKINCYNKMREIFLNSELKNNINKQQKIKKKI